MEISVAKLLLYVRFVKNLNQKVPLNLVTITMVLVIMVMVVFKDGVGNKKRPKRRLNVKRVAQVFSSKKVSVD